MTLNELKQRKIKRLVSEYGGSLDSILKDCSSEDSAGVPSICMNPDCNATYEYEIDQDRGWCEECRSNSVKSIMILAGII
jgi:hypothetical protein